MTQAPQPAPAGWYPSPDGAPVQRWWDGVMWTDATLAPEPSHHTWEIPAISGWAAPEPPRLRTLALLTRVAIALAGVAAPLAAGVHLWQQAAAPAWLAKDVVLAATGAASGLLVVSGTFWLVWQYRVASALPPGTTRRTPAWHVASWFVPVAAWWVPFQNVGDLFSRSTGRRPGWLAAWWTLWVAGVLVAGLGAALPVLVLVGSLLFTASAPFAWRIVERLTEAIGPTGEHHGD